MALTAPTPCLAPIPLRWGPAVVEHVRSHCRSEYPREACGILIGKDEFGVRSIVDAVAMQNEWSDVEQRRHRFTIDPRRQLEIERSLDGTGRSIIGFYHSHPDAPALPSAFDTEVAWAFYSYVIVSVTSDRANDVRAWVLDETNARFIEQECV